MCHLHSTFITLPNVKVLFFTILSIIKISRKKSNSNVAEESLVLFQTVSFIIIVHPRIAYMLFKKGLPFSSFGGCPKRRWLLGGDGEKSSRPADEDGIVDQRWTKGRRNREIGGCVGLGPREHT